VEKLPAATHNRLAKALALVQSGQVFERDNGYWEVASQREGAPPHSVNGACDCDWENYNKEAYCTHELAVLLQRKTLRILRAAHQAPPTDAVPAPTSQAPTASPQPLGEAPCSANTFVMVGAHRVQITIRGVDETEVLARMAKVIAQYPDQPQASSQPLSPQQHNAAAMHKRVSDFCKVHNAPMQRHENAGGVWYSHYIDGKHCKGR
jgi:hypothetical protein